MRVLQIAHGIPPGANGGVENYTDVLSRRLAAKGHDVTVAVPHFGGVPDAPLPYRVLQMPIRWTFGGEPRPRARAAAWQCLQNAVATADPDIIHFQHLLPFGWQSINSLAALDRPFVLSVPDYWYLCPQVSWLCRGSMHACVKGCLSRRFTRPFGLIKGWARIINRRRLVPALNRCPGPLVAISHRVAEIHQSAGVTPSQLIVHHWSSPPPSSRLAATSADQ